MNLPSMERESVCLLMICTLRHQANKERANMQAVFICLEEFLVVVACSFI